MRKKTHLLTIRTPLPKILQKSHIENIPIPWSSLKLLHFRITGRNYSSRGYPTRTLVDEVRQILARGHLALTSYTDPAHPSGIDANADVSDSDNSRDDDWLNSGEKFLNMTGLVEFASWAFGPYGLPGLQVIAFGDFSHRPRFDWTHVLLCRVNRTSGPADAGNVDPPFEHGAEQLTDSSGVGRPVSDAVAHGFRIMRPKDEYLLDQIKGGRALLHTAPTEPVLIEDDSFNDE